MVAMKNLVIRSSCRLTKLSMYDLPLPVNLALELFRVLTDLQELVVMPGFGSGGHDTITDDFIRGLNEIDDNDNICCPSLRSFSWRYPSEFVNRYVLLSFLEQRTTKKPGRVSNLATLEVAEFSPWRNMDPISENDEGFHVLLDFGLRIVFDEEW